MTDEEYREQVEQRWKETMALLGFDEAPVPPKPPKAASIQPAVVEPPVEFTPPASVPPQEVRAATPVAEPEPVELQEPEPEGVPVLPILEYDSASVTVETLDAPGLENVPDAGEQDEAEEKAGRRRRGRRGRRGKTSEPKAARDETASAASEEEVAPNEESDQKEGPRKRGRGRRPRPVKSTESQPAAEEEPASEEADDSAFGDDEPTNLSEWDVPSWQDLIASLYRPER